LLIENFCVRNLIFVVDDRRRESRTAIAANTARAISDEACAADLRKSRVPGVSIV
jgi:hypothetical protein